MNVEFLNFVNDNIDDIQKLYLSIYNLKKELRQRVQNLGGQIQYNEKICKQWLWRENESIMDDLVHDIYIDDAIVAVDTNDHPIGWSIHIWLRKQGTNQLQGPKELSDWLINKGIPSDDVKVTNQTRDIYSKKFDDTEAAAIQLQDILDKLCK